MGRFLSVDPLTVSYPMLTPYQFASNTPIQAIDLDGLEAAVVTYSGRLTLVFITGSAGISAAVDVEGNVSVAYTWSVGPALGLDANHGISVNIYPTAKTSDLIGSGINWGGGLDLGAGGIAIEGNASLISKGDIPAVDVKLGGGGGEYHLGGSVGGYVYVDYSQTKELLSFNLKDPPKYLYEKLNESMELTEDAFDDFVREIEEARKRLPQPHAQGGSKTNPIMKRNIKQSGVQNNSSNNNNIEKSIENEPSNERG